MTVDWYRNQIFTHLGMDDSKPTNVHVVTKYLGLDTWHMQNIQIMQFDIYKANVLEMLVNWSQPKTREKKLFRRQKPCFDQKKKKKKIHEDLNNKTQRPPLIKNLFEMLVSKNVHRLRHNCTVDCTPSP